MSVWAGRAEPPPLDWIQLLRSRASDETAYTFLADGEEEAARLSYAELDRRARGVAAALQLLEVEGERALLLYPPGLEFVTAFLGCLCAKTVAVPAYPPRSARTLPRLLAIVRDARPRLALTTSELLPTLQALAARVPGLAGLRWVATDALDVAALAAAWRDPAVDGDTLAFLQYTSGSTALPKGVMVTHGNLLHNEETIQAAFEVTPESVIVGWLPLYHDMGLIGNVLQPLYSGARCVLMSPLAFLQRPARWLRAISRCRATTSGGPNFAYELCLRKVPPAERLGLDLSSWRVAFNGAEPVRAETLERFAAAFSPCGFRREAFYPCYGLAEATLFVTGGAVAAPPVVESFKAADLERDRAVPVQPLDPAARRLAGCGVAGAGQEVVIAGAGGRPCPPGAVGEIWVAGPSVAAGYWGRPAETAEAFAAALAPEAAAAPRGPFLRTGDLGFLHGGELFVTGRLKDLVILRGRNHYPQDLELTAERSHPALRPGGGAAFSVDLEGEERLVVVHELDRHGKGAAPAAAEAVRQAIAEEHEAQVHEVVLIETGALPKTSSGKVQRHACRAAYLAGELAAVERSALAIEPPPAAEAPAGAALDPQALAVLPAAARRAAIEGWLRGAAAAVLGLPPARVEPGRPLTALGLDSLAAIELRARVESGLGVSPPLARLLDGAALSELAAEALERLDAGVPAGAPAAAPAAAAEDTGDFPLSYPQRALWFLHRFAPRSLAYHLAGAARVHGPLDAAALGRAFAALAERHAALRTTFFEAPEGPRQRAHAELPPEFVLLDCAPGEDLAARLREEVWRPFDLERGPLVRLGLLRAAGEEPLLFLAVHHIVVDFWSLAVALRDLGALYARECGRAAPVLPPLPLRFADHVRRQEERLAGVEGERLWDYWRATLAPGGAPPPRLELPADRPRPGVPSWGGGARGFRLGAVAAGELQALARRRGATPFMALLAVFESLLARTSSERELLIGSPAAGRADADLADLVGYFVNVVPLRVRIADDASFADLLGEVRRAAVGAFEHQDFPLALLAERLQPARDASRPPLFDVTFAFEKARRLGAELGGFALGEPGTRVPLGGLELESFALSPPGAPFALMLVMAEVDGGLGGSFRYATDLFDAATVARMAGHFQALLGAALAAPQRPLAELPLLAGAERQAVLYDWSDGGALPEPARGGELLHRLVEAQAARTPHAVAFVWAPEGGARVALTYAGLDARAERLAHRLAALGVGPEVRVGVALERTADLPVVLLAILKAGGAYVPLDPGYPTPRLTAIVDDARLGQDGFAILTQERLLPRLSGVLALLDGEAGTPRAPAARAPHGEPPELAGGGAAGGARRRGTLHVLCVDGIEESLPPYPESLRPGCPDPANLAYVIYTSGSTGRPKGVAIEHRSAAAFVRWAREWFSEAELSGVFASTSINFDLSVFELFVPLTCGGRVILGENALALAGSPAAGEVTLVNTVPSAIAELLRLGAVSASVRTVNLAGEPLRGALVERLYALGTVERVLNLYGPSEDTTYSTFTLCPRGGEEPTIGRAVAGSRAYVLDRSLEPCPPGVPGELALGGAGLARGYLHRRELTAERFVPDPFAADPGARLYRTGDLARWLPSGELEFLGRIDHQVKVRGFRIELGEIETALSAHPALREAVVVAREDGGAGEERLQVEKRLAAYVVPRRGPHAASLPEASLVQALRAFLAGKLPDYMVPSAIVVLDALPLTPNGKVDRKALPAPAAQAVDRGGAPRTPAEELLAGIWAEVLGRERVGIHDGFFDLGGHSLIATRVVSRVRAAFGVELPLRALFEHPTVAGLARALTAAAAEGSTTPPATPAPPPAPALLPSAARPDELPLSFAQERLWFLDRLEPASPLYLIPAAVRLVGELDAAALRAALGEIVRRHEVLRTAYVEAGGRPLQRIEPPAPFAVAQVDLALVPAPLRAGVARRLLREEAARPFDLGRATLLRATLLRLEEREHWLALTFHHIAADGWSMGVFLRELAALYAAPTGDGAGAARLAALPVQYADFALWQRAWLRGEALARQLAYWREALAGAPAELALPTDRPRPAVRRSRGAHLPAAFPEPLSQGLGALARRAAATPFMLLLAGFSALLARWSGQRDVVVGSPAANRGRLELEPLIGFFVNALPLRLDLGASALAPGCEQTAEPSFGDLVRRAREATLAAHAHQDLPFEKLVEELAPGRDPGRTPLFQVMLAVEPAPVLPRLPHLTAELVEVETGVAKFDLTLTLATGPAGLAGNLEYDTDLFDGATATRWLGQFRTLLAAAVAHPERALSELPLLGAAERRQLLLEWAGARPAYPRERCVHELFEEQARRRPAAVALAWDGGELTYGELEARANRLARRLRADGVAAEARVAVCLERSPELIVTLLAVLKAGGAYLPLDPAYPAERLAAMLEDGEAPVLVTVERLLGALPAHAARTVLLDRDAASIAAEDAAPLSNRAFPESLAYVLYTSGSTGRPKGVAVPHRGIVRLVTQDAFARFGEDEVFLQLAPIPFDASTLEIWAPLASGGRLALFPPEAPSLEALAEALARHGVTTLWLTAGLFHQMVEVQLPALAGVRQLLAGGDVLSVPHVRKVLATLAGRSAESLANGPILVNGYGPTESTTFTCCHVMRAGAELGATVPIGRPIDNTRVVLLDAGLRPVPIGVPGELFIGGDGLARGYLGRPDWTAERFVPDPLAAEEGGAPGGRPVDPNGASGARLYRTGDLARWLPDGTVEFLGRLDHQVKVRGFRIEPGEIETALAAHPDVAATAVVVVPNRSAEGERNEAQVGKRLVAYVVLRRTPTVTGPRESAAERHPERERGSFVRDLRSWLAGKLPDYMVPAAFVALDALPLTASGKVDRAALARTEVAADAAPAAAARTPVEELLAGAMAELLDGRRLGPDDDFFELGGHSLLAVRLVSRVRELLGVELPVRAVFERPTAAALAAGLWRDVVERSTTPPPAAAPPGAEPVASFAQQRLWFIDRLEPGSPAYNVPIALRLRGRLEPAALHAGLTAVVARHETLRTAFAERAGEPVPVVAAVAACPCPLLDLRALPEETRAREAERLLAAAALRPFDLARGPLLRAALLSLAAGEHVLVLALHHVVTDGWSMGVLLQELAACYGAFSAGQPPALAPLPLQYADYARWQRSRLTGEWLAPHLAWWRERLAGVPALDLPADRPRPAVRSSRGDARQFLPSPALARDLRLLARREGATLFMTLLAACETLLWRHTGQEDFAVGTPIANRERAEVEGLIGFFANTLALRSDVDGTGELTFRALLARVRETALAAYAHGEVPFELLVEELAPARDLSRTPLFQVLLPLQALPPELPALPGLELDLVPLATRSAKFDLTLAWIDAGDGATGLVEYDRDLFDAATAERIAARFQTLLAAATAAPDAALAALPWMPETERQQILEEWSDGGALAPAPCLHEAFAAQAARTPEAPALVWRRELLTYRDLERRSRRLAGRLRSLGVGPEVRVGILAERTPEMVVALLAVLRAGGAYVPLDPAYPAERLAFMLEDGGVALVLTQERLLGRLGDARSPAAAPSLPVLCLDAPDPSPPSHPEVSSLPRSPADPSNLAYLIYTSGSTGRPKGVAIEHRSAAALVAWARRAFAPEDLGAVLASTSICFDLSVFELFAPLAAGGLVVLADDALELFELPAAGELTLVNTVPSVMAELMRAGALPRSVRTVNLAGEPLKRELVERIHAAAPAATVYNLYGPSEDTTYSTFAREERGDRRQPSIGRPVGGTRAYVLDAAGDPVAAGVAGELCLGGEGLARGYLARPALTAERFVPDPFGPAGGRLYRTGDLARWRSDGRLDFLGRRDHQVKLRGFRIELGEIEAVLLAHPAVGDAVVVAREQMQEKKLQVERRLVAYLVPRRGSPASVSSAELRSWLSQRLPEHMLPAAFVWLPALPLTPNGKVDRKALPEPEAVEAAAGYVAPRTPAEERLAGIWAEVLGRERVGVYDSFFELGGHSLLAMRVVSRLRARLGVELPVRRVFEHPTLAALATEIDACGGAGGGPPLLRSPGEEPVASFAQQRLWFLDRLEPGSALYNIPVALRVRGRLAPAALWWSLTAVVARHEVLRTTFAEVAGHPVPVVATAAACPLPVVDLGGLGAAARQHEAARLAAEQALRPFDLARGPLLRAALLRLHDGGGAAAPADAESDASSQHLLLTLHHVAADGWSLGVLLREVAALYGAAQEGAAARLPDLPIQYADFARWQRQWLAGEALKSQLTYWRERLAGAPSLELPTDRPRPPLPSGRGGEVAAPLTAGLAGAVEALAHRNRSTPFMALLAAWDALLHRYGGGTDLVVGSPVAGRIRPDVERLIGCFVNTLALRTDLGAQTCAPSFRELLGRVRETALGAYAHQDLPFERLVEELQPVRDPSRTPIFQVMLVLQNAPLGPIALPGVALEPLAVPVRTAKFDLTLVLSERQGELVAELAFSRDLFDAATAARILRHFRALLTAAVATEAETAITALPLLDAAERHQLLCEWAGATPPYPRQRCVHELVAEHARRRPEAVALLWGEEEVASLTYGELEARANRLAHRLQRLRVTTDTVVGVCLERSPELIVTLLAVLKAGGAYLPLDPAYPAERLATMAAGSAAPVVVTIERLLPVLPQGAWRTLCLERERAALLAESAAPPPSRAFPESLAYVLYTSGSTGRPKGVAVPHRGIVRLVTPDTYHFSEEEVVLHATPLPFDVSTFEIWGALVGGGRLALAAPGTPLLGELGAALGRFAVTTFHPTAGMFLAMVEAELPALARIKQLVAGGDVLSPPHARRVLAALRSDGTFLNGYGPTEATVSTACHVMRPGDRLGDSVPIGRPVAHSRVVLLDARLEPVPVGMPGELYVGGDCLARGYLDRPDLTAERFVPDPLPPAGGGERLYRTGDLARWLPDGRLDFLGRVDRQVKIRGVRIEPAEIEAALAAHAGVAAAAVLARSDPARGKELVAYFVPRATAAGEAPAHDALREHLRARLPESMLPAFFVAVPALPLDPNGKLDRRALARIEPAAAAGESAGGAPRTPLEELLAGMMGELLGCPPVGIHDDFFVLGGHSLLAVRLLSRLRDALGVELPLRRLFERPTVAGLVGAIAAARRGEQRAAPPLTRLPEGAERPLSFAQERLWILDRFEPGNPAYNMPAAQRLRGALDVRALGRSLDALVARHEALRTTFPSRGGRATQAVAEHGSCPLPVVDLTDLAVAAREREAERLAAQEAARPFDLARGPLLRTLLVRIEGRQAGPAGTSLLLLAMHHIVSDGWSIDVFVRELAALYASASERRAPLSDAAALIASAGLRPLPIRYADYAAWQRRWLAGGERDVQLAYWRRRLAAAPQAIELPTDRPRPPLRTHRGGHAGRTVPAPVADGLLALARREGASLFMVMLAAFALLLHRLAGEEDVVVGTPIAGRGRTELEGLIGIFLNTLVLRVGLGGDPSVRELIGRVRETAVDAFAHQDVPFEMLLDDLKPERDLARTPLFQVFFNMLSPPAEMRLPGLTLEPLPPPETPSKFDLTLYAQPRAAEIGLDLVYNRDLFDPPRMEELLDQLCGLLHGFAGEAEAPGAKAFAPGSRRVSGFSLLTPAAAAVLPDPRAPLGDEWHGAVHERLTRQARRAPERPALADGAGAWTYGELEARSNRLAHALLRAGLRREAPVAIYAHRCATLVWAVLGTLKAGGAFVVLDPAYPPARQVEVLRLAAPAAFLHLAEAGPLPAEIGDFLAARPGCVRLDLAPATAEERAGGEPDAEPPAVAVGPDDLAVIAFTSGSTGVPKGILGRHGPLSHFLPWQGERFGLGEGDRFSMLSGLAHDPLQRDIFTPLWLGASLAIPVPADLATPGRLAEWMRREGVTVSHLTPAMAQILTERPAGAPAVELGAQRWIFLVGDVLTRRDVARLRRLAPAATVVNLYGSTETQRAVGYHVVADSDGGAAAALGREILPLGRGMRDVQLLVLAPAGHLAGIGEVGEICVRSPHLARGYLGDEAATRARFPQNPFTEAPGDRLYRTGDLGRYLPGGDVVFVARADQQVKIRGFRVELGEIEAQLGRLPGVREAVVLARGEGAGDRRLVAYLTAEPGAAEPPTVPRIRRALAERLPAYMVPSGFALLDRLPLTPNGKVDRKALARIDDRHRETDVDYKAPQTETERTIAAILAEVLAIDRVGADDNFFELGGNSLLLVQVHSRLQELFGREILLVELFNHPTVRALAEHLGGSGAAAAPPPPADDRAAQLRAGRERLRRRLERQRPPTPPPLQPAAAAAALGSED